MSYDDFPTTRQVRRGFFGYGVAIVIGGMGVLFVMWAFSVGLWAVTKPVDTAIGVVNRIMDPDAALQNYRWFRDARNGIEAQQANIRIAKQGLEFAKANAPERMSARNTELMGAQQVCNNLVGQYNSRSERIDSRLFKDPGQFLTGLVDGQRPTSLPVHFDYNICE